VRRSAALVASCRIGVVSIERAKLAIVSEVPNRADEVIQ
jgi:hypothetical protein